MVKTWADLFDRNSESITTARKSKAKQNTGVNTPEEANGEGMVNTGAGWVTNGLPFTSALSNPFKR
jgi:hypothetical protein